MAALANQHSAHCGRQDVARHRASRADFKYQSDRKLIVNPKEAQTVIDIFQRYVRLKSVRALQKELAADGIRSKERFRSNGTFGHQQFSQGAPI